ncbi:TadE/TadG family type IV pilus assembly protein [Bradyrhizobium sp.]|uniref:TadE/TadG family type IV pilus assembly protein n=1 Tax=Bradyrhizobium sp. TaxID=376 RepID=UPI0025C4425E|nr:TadE/TadG family type IV pilus assembly protein [Bradyrhizobium sp.]
MMSMMLPIWLRIRRTAAKMRADRSGIAATEFAVIVPIMLVMFFGTVEFSSGVAVKRKVTLMARTLSDLASQSVSVSNSDLTGFFSASNGIMTPYPSAPTRSTISQLYIEPGTLAVKVQWSQGSVPRVPGSTLTIPTELKVGGTYLIFSEVSYLYVPAVGKVMAPSGVNLTDVAYTRPRQSPCVIYPTPSSGSLPPCPTS